MSTQIEQGTMNNEEAAAYLGCTPDTLRVWTSRRRVPFVKVGRLTRFLKADLEAYLQQHRVPVTKSEGGFG
jgi:excisionase family DNA binding protein